jgi:hypothetical protein
VDKPNGTKSPSVLTTMTAANKSSLISLMGLIDTNTGQKFMEQKYTKYGRKFIIFAMVMLGRKPRN